MSIFYWFNAWRDPYWVPEGDAKALIRMAKRAGTQLRRWRAIYALGRLLPSDEIFDVLVRLLDDAAVAGAAIDALGSSNEPKGKALALNIARAGGPIADRAAEAIHFDRRSPKELLSVALTSSSYYEVKKAIEALGAWQTPDADVALEQFRAAPARQLNYERVDPLDSTGREFEGEPWFIQRSSATLGQRERG